MKNILIPLVAGALLAVTFTPAMADSGSYYRWVDEQGSVQFGQNPPENVEAEKIRAENTPPTTREERTESRTSRAQPQHDRRNQREHQQAPAPRLRD